VSEIVGYGGPTSTVIGLDVWSVPYGKSFDQSMAVTDRVCEPTATPAVDHWSW
jgi:hypothetical protein